MAYFVVIGTSNDVKCVVDEVKRAHLQHNVITSGCVLREDNRLYYQWDVFNEKGERTNDNNAPVLLHNALTNQISQFKTLLPDNAIPNVFIVAKCLGEEDNETLQMVCDELYKIGGATLSGLQVDIILLGYDLNAPEDVTKRPHWRILKSIHELGKGACFHTNILYVNNMDYMGAATNADSHILSRMLCNWSKMVCSGGFNPKATVQSHVYAIGMSEHQYDFRDLNEFFKLSAEERLLDRTLNSTPSADTQELFNTNYFKKIDLDMPWLDGLCHIQSKWDQYCTAKWIPTKSVDENVYSVTQQELKIASYLNSFLKLYISEEQREIETLNDQIAQKQNEKSERTEKLTELNALPDEDETKVDQISSVNERITQLDSEIETLKRRVQLHERNIASNTYLDANAFYEKYGTMELLTEEDETTFSTNKNNVEQLIHYVKSEAGINIMRDAIERATSQDVLPDSYPASEVLNMGRVEAIKITKTTPTPPIPVEAENSESINERSGCLFWFKSLFGGNKPSKVEATTETAPIFTPQSSIPTPITAETRKFLREELDTSIVAIKKADDVRLWWKHLCDMIDKKQKRLAECRLLMDGEKDVSGKYATGKEGYRPKNHRKSVSLIDMDRVRSFRDSDTYYKDNLTKFLDRWFDKSIKLDERMSMPELIKHQVLDPLVGKYHTLKWDGSNPFVKEDITNEEMHDYIEHDLKQSKPFVEYARIPEGNIVSNVNIRFYSNNPNIPTDASFRTKYGVSTASLIPASLNDFVNSLCIVQIMDIPNHVDELKDFKPKREAALSGMHSDIRFEVSSIVGEANTVEEKARAIYDWLCDNIAYDTTKQIHDADTCYKTKRGVCQAYCELFCYMAEAVDVTAEIIAGITKDTEGRIADDKHSWIFVYTHAYDGILIDPTWGAGSVDGMRYVKNEDNSIWFDVSPYRMIFSHFPDLQYWTKLDIPINEEQFRNLPFTGVTNDNDCKNLFFQVYPKTS